MPVVMVSGDDAYIKYAKEVLGEIETALTTGDVPFSVRGPCFRKNLGNELQKGAVCHCRGLMIFGLRF